MYAIDLENAQRGACELLKWSHFVLERSHGDSGPGTAPELLRQISMGIAERARLVEAVSPLIDSVASAPTLAGVSGASMHDVALALAGQIKTTAMNTVVQQLWRKGPDGPVLERRPGWQDVTDFWSQVSHELRRFPIFDCEAACGVLRDEAKRAASAFGSSTGSGASTLRPLWYKALAKLGEQFRDAVTRHALIACNLAHANSLNSHRLPDEKPTRSYVAGFSGQYRLTPVPCEDSRDLPFAVAIYPESSDATGKAEEQPQYFLLPTTRNVEYLARIETRDATDAFKAFELFNTLATNAGRCVADVPRMLLPNVTSQSLCETEGDRRWLWIVFDLAWYDGRSGLSARRQLVLRRGGGKLSYPYDLKFIRSVAERNPEVGIPPEWCEKLPEYYESKLDDIFLASAAAIDLILSNADCYFVAAAELGNSGRAGNDGSRLTVPDANRGEQLEGDPMADPIEDALHRQPLQIYRFLRGKKNWTSYNTLAAKEEFWRGGKEASARTIRRALKRLQEDLNELECGVTVMLTIEHENRRTRLEQIGP